MVTWYGIVLVVVICLIVVGVIALLCFRQCLKCKRSDSIVETEEGRERQFVFTIPMTVESKRPSYTFFGPAKRNSLESRE